MRGTLCRKHVKAEHEAYIFFRRALKKVQLRELVFSLKNAFIHIKNTKQQELKKYIFASVTKI